MKFGGLGLQTNLAIRRGWRGGLVTEVLKAGVRILPTTQKPLQGVLITGKCRICICLFLLFHVLTFHAILSWILFPAIDVLSSFSLIKESVNFIAIMITYHRNVTAFLGR